MTPSRVAQIVRMRLTRPRRDDRMGIFDKQEKKAKRTYDVAKSQNDAAKATKNAVRKTLDAFHFGKKRGG